MSLNAASNDFAAAEGAIFTSMSRIRSLGDLVLSWKSNAWPIGLRLLGAIRAASALELPTWQKESPMTLPTFLLRCGLVSLTLLFLLMLAVPASAQLGPLPPESDQTTVFRVDPKVRGVAPIEMDQLKVGAVYNHFSTRLNRRVWSLYLGNGEFWHAMAPGSVQPFDAFDVELSRQDAIDLLRQADPELAKQISITGDNVFLMLQDSGRWRLIPRSSVPRIIDAETGLEWEKQFGSYLHVIPRGSMLGIGLGCCYCW